MVRFQPIYDIAELCARRGLTHAVLSPGSRCAPLTLAFTRHPQLACKTISDERSAAFIGLGLAQQTKQATILVCTSGTAVYNFAPAVAEAYFSKTPLIIFTADRPAEWIAQQDGQTIHQENIFGKHVKKSFQLPQDYEHPDSQWAINRIVNEAIIEATHYPQGPVHINVPFREPLYPTASENFSYSKSVRTIDSVSGEVSLSKTLRRQLTKEWSGYHKVWIVAGQQAYHEPTAKLLERVCSKHNLPLAGDIISNLHIIENLVRYADLFLGQATDEIKKSLQPELLITFGESVISKNLKLFLRHYPATVHWHIQPSGTPTDSFQSLTRVIHSEPAEFFDFLDSFDALESFDQQKRSNYQKLWEVEERKVERLVKEFYPQEIFGELELVKELLHQLPSPCNLHLANSMSVRYANFIGLTAKQKGIEVFSNRGTSGIDGCTSTAIGHTLASTKPNILISGDMAFFYDRNAFWHNYPLTNFRAVVLNNHGGTIFNLIDGPSSLHESTEYFVTRQALSAKKLCEEFGFDYLKIDNKRKIKNTLKDFFDFDGSTKILEIETSHELNKSIFEALKNKIKVSYES